MQTARLSRSPAALWHPDQGQTRAPSSHLRPSGRNTLVPRALLAVACVVLICVQALTTFTDVQSLKAGADFGRRNLEASYHVLLTIDALRQAPLSTTLGLPIVTLGQANDKWITWGSAVPNAAGDMVYTSFPPLGFWAPLLASLPLKTPGLIFLTVFNGVLGAITACLLLVLVRRLALDLGARNVVAAAGGLLAGLLYLLSPESLQSNGIVYWPQSLNGIFLLIATTVLYNRAMGRLPRAAPVVVGLTVFLSCYTEWTGFVFGALASAACLLPRAARPRLLHGGVSMIVGLALAAVLLVAQFAAQVGWASAFSAWTTRAGSRAAGTFAELMYGWALSAGPTLLALILITVTAVVLRSQWKRLPGTALFAFYLLAAPVAENLALQQHATQFSFDRLKVVVLVAAAAGLLLSRLPSRSVLPLGAAATVLAGVVGANMQHVDEGVYAGWPSQDANNRRVVAQASAKVDFACATVGSNGSVRGYLDLAVDRSIVELTTMAALQNLHPSNPCGYVIINKTDLFVDLPAISSIDIVRLDGTVTTVKG